MYIYSKNDSEQRSVYLATLKFKNVTCKNFVDTQQIIIRKKINVKQI